MDIADHYALHSGSAPLASGLPAKLTVHNLGIVRVPSGKVGACDPFVDLENPVVVRIPPGDYPVRVTIADVSEEQDGSHLREAYLSLVMSEETPTLVEAAPTLEGEPPSGEVYGVNVDAGTVAFVDADSVARCMPEDSTTWYEDVFDTDYDPNSWFALMDADKPLPAGLANVELPRATAGENVVLAHSGWGDGFYPLLQTKDSGGNVTALHIDLLVVGKFDDALPSLTSEQAPPTGPAGPDPQKNNWLSKLLGR